MSDYKAVEDALAAGADPAMLCQTCPWDRFCITPPSMSRADVDAEIAKAKEQDEQTSASARAEGKGVGLPVGTLMTTLIYAGKHQTAQLCPVFALRLRTSAGKAIADQTRQVMQTWNDDVA